MDWLIWLGLALAAGLIEVITLDFVFLMFAAGGLAAAGAAGAGLPLPMQVLVFCATSVLGLVGVRPPLQRWAGRTPVQVMNTAALVGREAVVLESVTDRGGLVKLAGESWSARTKAAHPLEPGSTVLVEQIDGATAVVSAVTGTSAATDVEWS